MVQINKSRKLCKKIKAIMYNGCNVQAIKRNGREGGGGGERCNIHIKGAKTSVKNNNSMNVEMAWGPKVTRAWPSLD